MYLNRIIYKNADPNEEIINNLKIKYIQKIENLEKKLLKKDGLIEYLKQEIEKNVEKNLFIKKLEVKIQEQDKIIQSLQNQNVT